MPLHLHLDAVGGVAGDMFIAACVDAFPALRAVVLDAQRTAGLPVEVHCEFREHKDHALTGLRFVVHDPHDHEHRHAHEHGIEHHHDETPFARIRERLQASALAEGVKRRAIHIFTLLAEVEGQVHGVATDAVSFHELGGWDSIADIVGAAALIEALGEATWSVSALPLGRGRTRTAHGWLPVPPPATARLLEGYEFIDDGLEGERVTPTGAAILKHLHVQQRPDRAARRLLNTGYGFGTRTFPGLSNVLRLVAFEGHVAGLEGDRVAVVSFEVDDQSPEDLAIALDHLRIHPAVLDVVQMAAFGKKGRMSVHVQVLAAPEAADAVCALCLAETTTLGVRVQTMERKVLPRSQAAVNVGDRLLRVKVAERPGATTAKVESDDLRGVDGGRSAREQVRREAEALGVDQVHKRT